MFKKFLEEIKDLSDGQRVQEIINFKSNLSRNLNEIANQTSFVGIRPVQDSLVKLSKAVNVMPDTYHDIVKETNEVMAEMKFLLENITGQYQDKEVTDNKRVNVKFNDKDIVMKLYIIGGYDFIVDFLSTVEDILEVIHHSGEALLRG